MATNERIGVARKNERGVSLVMVSVGMVMLLALAGLAIDLVSLYVGRSEAQRAADAAALAGATIFVTSGCTSASGGCVKGGPQEALARQQAKDVGSQNSVGGSFPTILDGDIDFAYPTPENPTIIVTVFRDASHGGPMPTFFMKIFGVTSANISAPATAEAYNPSGGGPGVGTKCTKPWLMANCDYNHPVSPTDANANLNCAGTVPGTFASYYVKGSAIVNPGSAPTGVIGQLLTIKQGNPNLAAAPSKFYPVFLPAGAVASICPSCSTGGGGGGSALYRQNIECCNENTITCGAQSIQPINGDMTGPTRQGVDCLIHERNNGTGQDTLNNLASPMQISAGSNNPYVPLNTRLPTSDSVVTVPLYNGAILCPGSSCGTTVNVDGFMQMFVKEETNLPPPPPGTVNAYIMNVAGCTGIGGGGGGGGPINSGSASPIPVRLIHP